jgi:choline dehydrogenase-like flavoprotein
MVIPNTPFSARDFVSKGGSSGFDYIIVGGGTAGLTLAARLSEHPRVTVGVLEAGPAVLDDDDDNTATVEVPGRSGQALGGPLDWRFETVPQQALNGRQVPWPRGRVLGGSSALNFMTWNRPNREDLDAWEQLGNPGWGWESML